MTVYAGWAEANQIQVAVSVKGTKLVYGFAAVKKNGVQVAGSNLEGNISKGTATLAVEPGVYDVEIRLNLRSGEVVKTFQADTANGNAVVQWDYEVPAVNVQVKGSGDFLFAEAFSMESAAMAFAGSDTKTIDIVITAKESNGSLHLSATVSVDGGDAQAANNLPLNLKITGQQAETKKFTITRSDGVPISQGSEMPGTNAGYFDTEMDTLLLYGVKPGDYTIAAEDAAETIIISFDGNAGLERLPVPRDMKLVKDSEYLIENESSLGKPGNREGYAFMGWSMEMDNDSSKCVKDKLDTSHSYKIYAVWQAKTLRLNPASEGAVTEEHTIRDLKQNTVLAAPAPWEGHVFRGWYNPVGEKQERVDYSKDWNLTLTARWTKVEILDGAGVKIAAPDAQDLDKILGEAAENVQTLTVVSSEASDAEKKAITDAAPGTRTLSAFDMSVKVDGEAQTELNAALTFSVSVPLGTDFAVYRTHGTETTRMDALDAAPADGTAEGYIVDGTTVTIYASKFSTYAVQTTAAPSKTNTVTFQDAENGSTLTTQTTDANNKLTSLPDAPSRIGYTFVGWYWKNADGEETQVKANDTVFAANATVYAKWQPWSYDVTFDGNGGWVKDSTKKTEDVPAVYGTSVNPPEFERDYYTVTGWAKDKSGTELVKTPIQNLASRDNDRITLYAVWSYVPRTVTFDADGGKITENKAEVASVTRTTQENPINTLKATELPEPDSREGWYFAGWYTQKNGKGDLVTAGKTKFKTDATVYAYWVAFKPVTVTLKCQKGTMTVGGKDVSEGTMQTKWPGTLDGSLPTPARTGYKFQGWYTSAGVKVDESTVFLKDTTIYAHWASAVSSTGNPKTGDQIMLEAAVAVLVFAAAGLCTTVVIMMKQKRKK